MLDGRVRVKSTQWDKTNIHANTQTPYHTKGKSLDDHGPQRQDEAFDNWTRAQSGREEEAAFQDFIKERDAYDAQRYGKVRPRTVNIPRKKIDRLIQSVSKTVGEIKENAGFAVSDAKKFAEKIFDEIDYRIYKIGNAIGKAAKKFKNR